LDSTRAASILPPRSPISQPPRVGPVKAGRVFRGHPKGSALIGPSTVASLIGSGAAGDRCVRKFKPVALGQIHTAGNTSRLHPPHWGAANPMRCHRDSDAPLPLDRGQTARAGRLNPDRSSCNEPKDRPHRRVQMIFGETTAPHCLHQGWIVKQSTRNLPLNTEASLIHFGDPLQHSCCATMRRCRQDSLRFRLQPGLRNTVCKASRDYGSVLCETGASVLIRNGLGKTLHQPLHPPLSRSR
jgi:hypothetical protein